jgi:plastocyanin
MVTRELLSAVFFILLLITLSLITLRCLRQGQEAQLLDPSKVTQGATIRGTIKLDGDPEPPKPVDMSQKPDCVKLHAGKQVLEDRLIVGPEKGLKDVFVYIKKGLEKYKFELPNEPAVLDQKDCMFAPHVFGMMVGQDLEILNSDPVNHNINVKEVNPFNAAQVAKGPSILKQKWFKKPGIPVSFQCDVHSWMHAYACVLEHPYYAVTKEDGKFEIKNLPPGKYTLAVWHEPRLGALGELAASPSSIELQLKEGETRTMDFTYRLFTAEKPETKD